MKDIVYGSQESIDEIEDVLSIIMSVAEETSIELGKEKGSFPAFNESSLSSSYDYMRNAHQTSIAPTGSISIIAGCSSGIEPLFTTGNLVGEVSGMGEIEIKSKHQNCQSKALVTGTQVHWKDHMKVLAIAQEYTNTGVSKTISIPFESTPEDIKEAVMMAWKMDCKGVTVFREDNGEREGRWIEVCPECSKNGERVKLERSGRVCRFCPKCGHGGSCSI
jgi:ribonucleoside-diphosphate reductase alpha chain